MWSQQWWKKLGERRYIRWSYTGTWWRQSWGDSAVEGPKSRTGIDATQESEPLADTNATKESKSPMNTVTTNESVHWQMCIMLWQVLGRHGRITSTRWIVLVAGNKNSVPSVDQRSPTSWVDRNIQQIPSIDGISRLLRLTGSSNNSDYHRKNPSTVCSILILLRLTSPIICSRLETPSSQSSSKCNANFNEYCNDRCAWFAVWDNLSYKIRSTTENVEWDWFYALIDSCGGATLFFRTSWQLIDLEIWTVRMNWMIFWRLRLG